MAEEVGNLKVKLGMDDAEFTKSISSLSRNMRAIGNELKGLKNKGTEWGNSLTGLKAKHDTLNRALTTQKQQVQALESAYSKSVTEKGKDAKVTEELYIKLMRAQSEYNKFETELNQVSSALNKQQSEISKAESKWSQLGTKLSTVGGKMKTVGTSMKDAGTKVAQSFGAAAVTVGAALGVSVKKAADFESQMSKVGAIAGASGKDLDKLKASALDLGAKTSLSASQVAEAMSEMAAKGYNTNQIIASMPGVISAAEASGEDLAMVADTISSAINAFGLSAKDSTHVADVLAKAANDSAAGIGDMQYAFKYAAPVADTLGISMEELSASVELMSNNGIKGEQAGTSLRAALLRLAKPPKAAANVLKDLGVSITDSSGKMLPFKNIIGQLSDKTKGMTNAQKSAALSTIFGTEAVSGMLAIVNAGPEKLDKLTKSLENSDGASAKAAAQMKDNLKGALQELQGSFETAQISIGTALIPAIEKLAVILKGVSDKFNSLSPGMQQFIAIGGAVATVVLAIIAAVGGFIAIIGGAISGIGSIVGVFSTISTAIASAGGAMAVFSSAIAVITGPIGIAIAAIVALVAAGIALWKNWDTVKNFLSNTWNSISSTAISVFSSIGTFFANIWNSISSTTSSVWNSIKSVATTIWSAVSSTISSIVGALVSSVMQYYNNMRDGISSVLNGIKSVVSGIWIAIKNVFLGAVLLIFDLVTGNFKKLKSDSQGIMNNLKSAMHSIWNGIKSIVTGVASAVKGYVITTWNNIKSVTSSVWNGIKSLISNVWNGIKSTTSSILNGIKSVISNIFGGFKSVVSSAMNGVKSAVENGWNKAKNFLSGINLSTIGKNIIQGLVNGITNAAGAVKTAVQNIANGIPKAMRKLLGIHSPSRVMRDEVGYWISEGLAKGIEANTNAEKAAKKKAQAIVNTYKNKLKELDTQYKAGMIDTSAYVKGLNKLKNTYGDISGATTQINAKIATANTKQAVAEQKKRQDAQKKLAKSFNDEMTNLSNKYNADILTDTQYIKKLENMKKKYSDVTNAISKIDLKIANVKKAQIKEQFKDDKDAYAAKKKDADASMQDELDKLKELSKHYKKNSDERIYFENLAKQKKQEITEAKKKIDEDYLSKVEELNTKLVEGERDLRAEYQKTEDNRAQSLYNFDGLFDEVATASDVSGAQLIANLEGQVFTMQNWATNLKSLAAKGVDQGLIEELQQMGPKSAAEIAALNTLSGPELETYVGLWKEKSNLARTEAVSELEGARIEMEGKVDELKANTAIKLGEYQTEWETSMTKVTGSAKNMAKKMPSIGNNAVQGLIDGLNAKLPELEAVAAKMASLVAGTVQTDLDIHSPSRVMKKLGMYTNEGFIVGLQDSFGRLKAAMSNMYGSLANSAQTMMSTSTTNNVTHSSYDQSRSYQPSVTIINQNPSTSPSQLARKAVQEQRRMAMEWGV